MKRGVLNRAQAKKAKAKLRESKRSSSARTLSAARQAQVSTTALEHECTSRSSDLEETDEIGYPEDRAYCTTLPKAPAGAKPKDFPDDWVECLFYGGHLEKLILDTPGFPSTIPHFKPAHRIAPVPGMGMGMLAMHDLNPYEMIISERPIVIAPAANSSVSFVEWDMQLLAVFNRLAPENQEAYMALANMHEDHGPILGRFRTNAFRIPQFQHLDGLLGPVGAYAGVCKNLSRINHSCTPNALWTFDMSTLSHQLYSTVFIKTGEQITISYTNTTEPYIERHKAIARCGFDCQCNLCKDPEKFDPILAEIVANADRIGELLEQWRDDPSEPDLLVAKHCFHWGQKMVRLNVNDIDIYFKFVKGLFHSGIELGSEEMVMKFSPLMAVIEGMETPFSEKEDVFDWYANIDNIRSDPSWGARRSFQPQEVSAFIDLLNLRDQPQLDFTVFK